MPLSSGRTLMLTGGRAAQWVYQALANDPAFLALSGVRCLFGDERAVPMDHPDSNYRAVMSSLFSQGIPTGCTVEPMPADQPDLDQAAMIYSTQIPPVIDLLLLSVGEDGHIASLFPGRPALHEQTRLVVPVSSPKPPPRRLTITPPVLQRAKRIVVLAYGSEKSALYAHAQTDCANIDALPARLVRHGEWLITTDRDALQTQARDIIVNTLRAEPSAPRI